jgi:hypothetical protein
VPIPETTEFANRISAPEYVRCAARSLSGAETFVLNGFITLSVERAYLYSCGGLVLHVWKHVSIRVQREGRAGVSELLRNNFRRHPGCQRDCGRRVAQIIGFRNWTPGPVQRYSQRTLCAANRGGSLLRHNNDHFGWIEKQKRRQGPSVFAWRYRQKQPDGSCKT